MSAVETAKEIGRIAAATTLGKDVIDLLEKKITLLTEQVTTLETENKNLKTKVDDLAQELDGVRPKTGRLQEGTEKLLQLLFQRDEITTGEAASFLGISQGMAEYHKGVLMDAGMVAWTRIGIQTDWGTAEPTFGITHEGREYGVRHGLVT